MRYLTIAAEYTQSPLHDDFQGPIDLESAGISAALSEELQDWNDRYREIIPLGSEQRQAPSFIRKIELLDMEGIELAERVAQNLGDAKVRYYSEGLLRHLTRSGEIL